MDVYEDSLSVPLCFQKKKPMAKQKKTNGKTKKNQWQNKKKPMAEQKKNQ